MHADSTIRIPQRLAQLDGYLANTESRCAGIRKSCEKKIVWYGGRVEKRPLAIVYLHGFSASRMETWPLCDRLAASIGANLFYTRLAGHGQDGTALGAARVEEWLADGLEAMAIGDRIGERIILVGASTGGTLATWLAAQPSVAPLLQRLILLSPNFMPKNPMAAAALWPPSFRLVEAFFGSWRCFSAVNRLQARYWTTRYPLCAVASMMQMVKKSWRADLRVATMPVLMLINPWDRIINVSLALARFMGFPSPRKRLIFFRANRDPGRHVLAGSILSPETTATVLGIIRKNLNEALK
ncbi:alpha/beta hydrolase [Desulfosarcina ovata]|uniref:Lysophospholipase n=1 Tax=Desulfosarcina ovata subsp. ovata TaxID=2752305 RepID=A0A5K8A846_9BACT|nr:alpha/beta fold hydrolase [Desulfosarcina ovata]BBO88697.1 lysophospholipase [Desulfosarcina ovata subsp. ovata]